MTRSVWKGPFVDGYLLKKADAARGSGRKEVIKTWSRRSTIMPQFVGLTFGVHNGQSTSRSLSPRTWSAISSASSLRPAPSTATRPTRRPRGSEPCRQAPKNAARGSTEATRPRGRAQAAHQPAQAESGGPVDPRHEGAARARTSCEFSAQAHRHRRAQGARYGDLQRREQPQPRHRRSGRGRGLSSARTW